MVTHGLSCNILVNSEVAVYYGGRGRQLSRDLILQYGYEDVMETLRQALNYACSLGITSSWIIVTQAPGCFAFGCQ